MSFSVQKDVIEEGDTVILYVNFNSIHALRVQRHKRNKKGEEVEHVFQTSFGALPVKRLIGLRYGSRVELPRGYVHAMQPTPELWTLALPHRTQIIYTPDVSLIVLNLDLRPGSVVCEAGNCRRASMPLSQLTFLN